MTELAGGNGANLGLEVGFRENMTNNEKSS